MWNPFKPQAPSRPINFNELTLCIVRLDRDAGRGASEPFYKVLLADDEDFLDWRYIRIWDETDYKNPEEIRGEIHAAVTDMFEVLKEGVAKEAWIQREAKSLC